MKKAYDKIAAGLEDAIAVAGGDPSRGRVRAPVDVRAIRVAANMSQSEFARIYRFPVSTIQEWEQNRRRPDTAARVLLSMIAADPAGVRKIMEKV